MYLFVFIKKKLISVDTILPVVLELKTRSPRLKVIIIAPDQKTFDEISKNKTLKLCIEKNFKLIQLGGLSNFFFTGLLQRTQWLLKLLFIFLLLTLNKAKVIHFGSLEEWPRRLVTFTNRGKIVLFESNGWGTGEFEDQIDALNTQHIRLPITTFKSSGALVGFSSNWRFRSIPEAGHLNVFSVRPSKLWPAWQMFLNKNASQQWEEECKRICLDKNKKVFLFILGTLDALPSLDMGCGPIDDLVVDTLDAMYLASPNATVLMKPHPITNIARLEGIIKRAKSNDIHITYLHPGVVAHYSFAAICNYYSTSLIDLWYSNVPTIEYTKYREEGLRLTGGGSMRPEFVDHFIEIGKTDELGKILTKCAHKKPSKIPLNKRNNPLDTNDSKVVDFLLS